MTSCTSQGFLTVRLQLDPQSDIWPPQLQQLLFYKETNLTTTPLLYQSKEGNAHYRAHESKGQGCPSHQQKPPSAAQENSKETHASTRCTGATLAGEFNIALFEIARYTVCVGKLSPTEISNLCFNVEFASLTHQK